MQVNFTPQHYHGNGRVVVVQQAMMAARCAGKIEAPLSDGRGLEAAEERTWELITAHRKVPLGRAVDPGFPSARDVRTFLFGQNAGDHTESNPNQGWSHSFIGVRPASQIVKIRAARSTRRTEFLVSARRTLDHC